ncbi:MAG: hypothetical protein M3295_02730, partial [Chloroflexota bacterium]|nr:hypothetical protein [Chloroflexota bacterium]
MNPDDVIAEYVRSRTAVSSPSDLVVRIVDTATDVPQVRPGRGVFPLSLAAGLATAAAIAVVLVVLANGFGRRDATGSIVT